MLNKYLALDVGQARIGLAIANGIARIAAPLPACSNDEQVMAALKAVIAKEAVTGIVIGWPRNLNGQETQQTKYVADFIAKLQAVTNLPIQKQDEALTSVTAEAELNQRKTAYSKADIDSLSAVYILEDYLRELPQV